MTTVFSIHRKLPMDPLPIASYFCLFLVFIHSASLQAQDTLETSSDSLTYTLQEIEVRALRTTISPLEAPMSLSIKSRSIRELSGSSALSLESITQNLPGIWVNNRQNNALGERITIRGIGWRAAFGVRGIQIVLNGIPLTVADGQSITNIIDPSLIRRIELLRGPAASYWGNSSGGVLYVSTQPDYMNDSNFYIRAQGDSYRGKKLDFQYKNRSERHRFSTYTSYNYDGGYRNYSAAKLFRSGIQGQYQFKDDSRLSYMGGLLWMPQAQHPSGLSAEQVEENPRQAISSFVNADAGKQVTQGQLGFQYTRNTSLGLVDLTGYGIYRDLVNPLPFGIITVDRLAGGFRGAVEKYFDDLTLKFGAEIKLQRDDREEFENNSGERGAITVNQLEKVSNQALFVTSNYKIGNLDILASLRYDRITFASDSAANTQVGDRTFSALSPSIGLSYQVGNSQLYGNLSTSFEAPTTTELVNRPDGGNGFNPDLKPEQTVGLEVGSRGTLGKQSIKYDIVLYQLWIQDLLFPYQLEANGPTFYRNQGETRHRGVEAAVTIQLSSNISWGATYTLTDAEFIEAQNIEGVSLEGKSVPGVADHRLSTQINWASGNFWTEFHTQYVSSYPANNLNTVQNDSYTVFDFKLSYQKVFEDSDITITPFVNINNIFDTRYNGSVVVNAFGGRYYEPAPGRNWRGGISMQF